MTDTLTSFTLEDELGDTPPDSYTPSDSASGDAAPTRCVVDGCTNAVAPYGGRGKRPTKCVDHKGKVNLGTGTAARQTRWAEAADIESTLALYFAAIGGGVSLINEYDGRVIVKGGDAVAHELVELARQDKALRRWLVMLATPGKYGPLIIASAGIALPILANHKLLPQFRFDTEGSNA